MHSAMAGMRSFLFVPGSDERRVARALEAGADAVIADLEDSVVHDEKARARSVVAEAFAGSSAGPARLVRVNGADTAYFADDLAATSELELDGIVMPKATPEAVADLGDDGPPVIAIVETARGVRLSYETASSERVAALLLGAADLGAQLWLEPRADGQELLYARSKLVVDSADAGIRPPVDVVHLDVKDEEGLAAECRLARSLGMRGKACIHPGQVATVNEIFTPTEGEIAWAGEVLSAYADGAREGRGAIVVRGALVDRALVERAERILADVRGGSSGR